MDLPHDQHGTRRIVQDCTADRAEYDALSQSESATAGHDQIGLHFARHHDHGFSRLAESGSASWPGISLIRVTPPGGSFAFAAASPQRRIYFADRVVGYRCSGGQLLRYEDDQLRATLPAALPAPGRLQADRVQGCDFRFDSASGLASLRVNIGAAGESIRLARQVQVNNAP